MLFRSVGAAIGRLTLAQLRETFARHEVGFSPIYDIKDVFEDPHFRARETIVSVPDGELGSVRMQGVVPRFSETPAAVRRAGPAMGEHNDEIWRSLGLSAEKIDDLKTRKII